MPGNGPHWETGRAPGESGYKAGCRCDECKDGHKVKSARQWKARKARAAQQPAKRGREPGRPAQPRRAPERGRPARPAHDTGQAPPARQRAAQPPGEPGSRPVKRERARSAQPAPAEPASPAPGSGWERVSVVARSLGFPVVPVAARAAVRAAERMSGPEPNRGIRYYHALARRGQCQIFVYGESPCSAAVNGIWMVDDLPACQAHYDAIRAAYPSRVSYRRP